MHAELRRVTSPRQAQVEECGVLSGILGRMAFYWQRACTMAALCLEQMQLQDRSRPWSDMMGMAAWRTGPTGFQKSLSKNATWLPLAPFMTIFCMYGAVNHMKLEVNCSIPRG